MAVNDGEVNLSVTEVIHLCDDESYAQPKTGSDNSMAGRAPRGLVVPFLRAWRMERVLTQLDLAERSGINKVTILRAEAGERISFANIHKLAAALGVSVHELLREEPGKVKTE